MKTADGQAPAREQAPRPELQRRYGSVAMPALAAALRYQSDGKNPEYAPSRSEPSLHEHAA